MYSMNDTTLQFNVQEHMVEQYTEEASRSCIEPRGKYKLTTDIWRKSGGAVWNRYRSSKGVRVKVQMQMASGTPHTHSP
jgi:hypothetical protein